MKKVVLWIVGPSVPEAGALATAAGLSSNPAMGLRMELKSFDEPALLARSRHRPTAIVLALSRECSLQPGVCAWAMACVRRCVAKTDFRTFVILADDGSTSAAGNDPTNPVSILLDTILGVQTIATLSSELHAFLDDLPNIRDAHTKRVVRRVCVRTIGIIATLVQICVAIILVLDCAAAILNAGKLQLAHSSIWVALHIFLAAPLLAQTLAARFNFSRSKGYVPLALLALLAYRLSGALPLPLDASLLGMGAGIAAEIFRRASLRERTTNLSIDPTSEPLDEPALTRLTLLIAEGKLPTARSALLVPDREPRVFLSYSRASTWSSSASDRLRTSLAQAHIPVFMDLELGTGSNLRQSLSQCLRDANIFISFADRTTIQRPWPAAELTTALLSHALWGGPEIVILKDPDLSDDELRNARTVFRVVLSTCADFRCPRVLNLRPDSDQVQLRMLRDHFHLSKSALRSNEVHAVTLMSFPVLMVAFRFGPLATIVGWPALAAAIADAVGLLDIPTLLPASAAGVAGLVLAFWAGCAGRFAIGSRFDIKVLFEKGAWPVHAAMCLSFTWLTARILWGHGAMALAWAGLITVIAWALADVLIYWAQTQIKGLIRPLVWK